MTTRKPPASPERQAVTLTAMALGIGVVTVIAMLAVRAGREKSVESDMESRCDRVARGDDADEVFARIGLDGYRPGCGESTPCDTVDLGGLTGIPWLCDPDDCSQLWRAGQVACLVDLDPRTLVVIDVTLMTFADPNVAP